MGATLPAPSAATATPASTLNATVSWSPAITVVAVLTEASPAPVAWAPNRNLLAYFAREISSHAWLRVAAAPYFVPRALYAQNAQVAAYATGTWLNLAWQPDGSHLAFVVDAERTRPGDSRDPLTADTIALIAPDGSGFKDLLPDWRALVNAPTYMKGLAGWLDNDTLVFQAHCGAPCAEPYLIRIGTGALQSWRRVGFAFQGYPFTSLVVSQPYIVNARVELIDPIAASNIVGLTESASGSYDANRGVLTPPTSEESYFVDWSPSSQHALVAVWPGGVPVLNARPDLKLWDIGQNRLDVFAPGAMNASWSPNGAQVALLVPGEPRVENGQLLGTDYATMQPLAIHTLVVDAQTRHVEFFARGERISNNDNTRDLDYYLGAYRRPVWSPAGRYLAYWDAAGDLAVLDLSTNAIQMITENSGAWLNSKAEGYDRRTYLAFSYDERYLAVSYPGPTEHSARLAVIQLR